MNLFLDYVKKREALEMESSADDMFRFNQGDEEVPDDYEHVRNELFKIVMSKYPDETMQFLNSIGNRGDTEIAALLQRLGKPDRPQMPQNPNHPADKDEVVPSSADMGQGAGE